MIIHHFPPWDFDQNIDVTAAMKTERLWMMPFDADVQICGSFAKSRVYASLWFVIYQRIALWFRLLTQHAPSILSTLIGKRKLNPRNKYHQFRENPINPFTANTIVQLGAIIKIILFFYCVFTAWNHFISVIT